MTHVSSSETTARGGDGGVDVAAWRMRIRNETSARYHLAMGDGLWKEGNHTAAVAAYHRAAALQSDLWQAHAKLAMALRELGRTGEAQAVDDAARALNPAYQDEAFVADLLEEVFRKGSYAVATDRLAAAAARMPHDPRIAGFQALALVSSGRIEEGRALFTKLLPRLDTDGRKELIGEYRREASNKLWVQPWAEGSFDQAIALIGCTAELDPDDIVPPADLCLLWFLLYRPQAMLDFLVHSPLPARRTFLTRGRQGWAHLMIGQLAEGEAVLRGVLDEKPAYDAFINYVVAGVALARHLAGHSGEAAEFLDRDMAEHPGHFFSQRVRGMLELAAGRPEKALGFLEAAATAAPAMTSILADIGLCRHALGDPARAEAIHRTALAGAGVETRYLIPDDPWVTLCLSLALHAQGRSAEATDLYRSCLAEFRTVMPFLTAQLPAWASTIVREIQAQIR